MIPNRIGVGTARGAETDSVDGTMFDIIMAGIRHGVTVLDTAVNYRSGRSEYVVGAAVGRAVRTGVAPRGQLTVATKVGYPRPPGRLDPVGPAPEHHPPGGYCLAPECVRHSIATSRATLGLDRIDLVHLHNPERLDGDQEAVDGQLTAAMEVLEAAVADGWIGAYGMSTWDLAAAPDPRRMVRLADRVAGGGGHFRAVQAPLSLLRRDALKPRFPHDGRSASLIGSCEHLGLAFIASAAAGGGRSPRLAAASARWVASVPGVTTALIGTLDQEHLLAALEPGATVRAMP